LGWFPCELLYANDLVVIAGSEEEVIRKLIFWNEGLEKKGLRVNLSKTKLVVGGERRNTKKTVGKWPYAVCDKGVVSNLEQYSEWLTETRMIRWMCGVKLRDKPSCIELRKQLGIEDIVKVVQWYGHVSSDEDWVKNVLFWRQREPKR